MFWAIDIETLSSEFGDIPLQNLDVVKQALGLFQEVCAIHQNSVVLHIEQHWNERKLYLTTNVQLVELLQALSQLTSKQEVTANHLDSGRKIRDINSDL